MPEIEFHGGVQALGAIAWKLVADMHLDLVPGWRNPVASVCDVSGSASQVFGCVMQLQGIPRGSRAHASGFTLLPSQHGFAPLLVLVMADASCPVRLKAHTDGERVQVSGCFVGKTNVSFEEWRIDWCNGSDDVRDINRIRTSICQGLLEGRAGCENLFDVFMSL